MRYQVSYCDPFKPDIEILGDFDKNDIIAKFSQISWNNILDKVDNSDNQKIYYSPTFEIENKSENTSLSLSYTDKNNWHIFFKRPKKKINSNSFNKSNSNFQLNDIPEQSLNTALRCIDAFLNNDNAFLKKTIDYKLNKIAYKESKIGLLLFSVLIFISFILPLVGLVILNIGFYSIGKKTFSVVVPYFVIGLILLIWGHQIPYLKETYKQRQDKKKKLKNAQYLRTNGKKYKIPASKIKVTGHVNEKIIKAVSPRNVFGLLLGALQGTNRAHDIKDYEGVSCLTYTMKIDNGVIQFKSNLIKKDPVYLEFKLEKMKEFDLYVDPQNINNYLLDIEGI